MITYITTVTADKEREGMTVLTISGEYSVHFESNGGVGKIGW